jgi:O-antigen ligase like membrane protein
MITPDEKSLNKFEFFLLIFISIQPIIDILTTFSMVVLKQTATFGVFFRLLVMGCCFFYIIKKQWGKERNITLLYLFSLILMFALNLTINFFFKENFVLMDEIKFLAKNAYAIIMLFTYIILFSSISKQLNLINILKKYLLYAILIINFVMLISILTSTSLKSYDYTKIGFTGWFFAGNEIGAILAIIFPISIIYALSKTTEYKYSYYWIPVIFTGYSLLMLGTKVGYGALLLSLMITLFMCFISWFRSRKELTNKKYLINSVISFLILVTLVVITPFTPVFKNTFAHIQLLGIEFGNTPPPAEEDVEDTEQVPELQKEQVENLLLSSREIYLKKQHEQFKEAPIIQKLFGMGYAGNYKEEAKLIEMDFYDLFFSLGILGFIIFILPFAYFLIKIGLKFFKNFSKYFNPVYILFLTSIALGLGIAYTAGHVFTAPAVSIYLGIMISYLIVFHMDSDKIIL